MLRSLSDLHGSREVEQRRSSCRDAQECSKDPEGALRQNGRAVKRD